MEGKLVHIHCTSLLPWPPKSRDVTAQKLSRGEEKQRLDRLLRETAKITICRHHPSKSHAQNKNSACVLFFMELCLRRHLQATPGSTELGGCTEGHRQQNGVTTPSVNLWSLGYPWRHSSRGKLHYHWSSVGACWRQSPPHYLTCSFNTARCHLRATFSTCQCTESEMSAPAQRFITRRLRPIFSPAQHAHTHTHLPTWYGNIQWTFFSRLFFCCLQVSQHNSVRLYQDPELAIL